MLEGKLGTRLQGFQLADKRSTVDQQRLAGLITAKGVHQIDSPPAPEVKQTFEHHSVNHRDLQSLRLLENLSNSK
jgi:hypothetical protein